MAGIKAIGPSTIASKIKIDLFEKMHVTVGEARRIKKKKKDAKRSEARLSFFHSYSKIKILFKSGLLVITLVRPIDEYLMHTLSFSLTLESVVRIHDAVVCLAKFSEVVSLEARTDKVRETP